jgi:hypothetical protein
MQAKITIKLPKHFITSKEQLMTSSGLMLDNFELKKSWYKGIAKMIYDKSQELVPVKTGRLKKSGRVRMNNDGTYRVEYMEPYAIFVHEMLGLRHETPTQAKFLEDAGYLVLEELDYKYNLGHPMFTFSMEMGMREGVKLHIDKVSMEEFLNWVKETRGTEDAEDINDLK